MRNKKEKRQAEQVERYVDRDADYSEGLDAATEQIVDTLHQAASETRPRPGFINELANQLREQETTVSDKPTRTLWGIASRLLLGGVAVAAVALFALYLAGLFGASAVEPSISENDLPPRPELQVEGGQHFPNAEFEVMVELSEEGGEVPLYTARQAPLPATVAEARALGERFGLDAPTVYESPSNPGRWTVMGANGRNISFSTTNAGLEGFYYSAGALPVATVDGEPIGEAEAEAAAISFLENAEMLPEEYRVDVLSLTSPVQNVRITLLLDGHPLSDSPAPIEVGVGPEGDILHARVNLLDPEPVGESIPVKSAADAFAELVEGTSPSMSYSFEQVAGESSQSPHYFSPPAPDHAPGDEVQVTGWVNVLVPVAEGEMQAVLHPRSGGAYYLEGPAVAELAESPTQSAVQVEGTIKEALGPQTWSLSANQIESAPDSPSFECLTGQVRRDGNTGILETDAGERYALAYLPGSFEGDARAEVCADNFESDELVAWLHMASPPPRESSTSGGGGGGVSGSVSVAVESVEAVEVTRIVTEDSGSGEGGSGVMETSPSTGDSGSGGGGGGGGVAPAPAGQPAPYQPGEIVEITGIVEGVIFEEEGQRTYEITLRQEESERTNETGEPGFAVYPLLGEARILEEIAEANRLHVRVTGQIIPAPREGRSGTHNQALVVQSFERADPDEKVVALLGHLEQRTSDDGEAQTIFVDEESGDRYLLSHPVNVEQQPADRRVWLAGVVDPEQTVGDLPLLRLYSSRTGSDVDQAESADEIDFNPGMDVVERSQVRESGLQGTLLIEEVILGYTYASRASTPPVPAGEEPAGAAEPVTLQPTWFFSGRSEDGNTTFTIQIPATAVDSGGGRE